jgi:type II secretory ATPase GspE/PulE/Tfp pilus assembly ATPase PilB-like protein
VAEKSGMRSMFDDGVLKVKMGLTTLDEVVSVTGEE